MSLERIFDGLQDSFSADDLYSRIVWPAATPYRPYVFINMASTADGKVVVGPADGPSRGVGGPTDQILYRRLQRCCDGALTGGTTLRASHVIYPAELPRFTVTRSGNLPLENRFFTDAPDRVYVFVPESLDHLSVERIRTVAHVITAGSESVDLAQALNWMRVERGIENLLCEGGPDVNDQLVRGGLVDELFLTLAPKVKGGIGLPTIVGGKGFPPWQTVDLTLLSVYKDADELYLRYRVGGIRTI